MFGIFDKIEEFFKDLLLGGIQANLEDMCRFTIHIGQGRKKKKRFGT